MSDPKVKPILRRRRDPSSGFLEELFRAALAAVEPRRVVRHALDAPAVRRALALRGTGCVGIFAVGKAAAGMIDGAREVFRDTPALVVLPNGYALPSARAVTIFSSHPEPGRASVRAARRALAFFREFSAGDVLLCLVSGGSSSLLCLPRPGITLVRKRDAVRRLARSGATIEELNRLRIRLSAVKGGRLAAATRARVVTLVLSDVAGDRPEVVGSGPTIRQGRASANDLVRVVGSNRDGIRAAAAEARARGWIPIVRPKRVEGEAALEGRRVARRAMTLAPREVWIEGGEATVMLGSRPGRGGRTLEVALSAGLALERIGGGFRARMLVATSDGFDGNSGLAGAFADARTAERARALGIDPEAALARHDAAPLFEALGDAFRTGPTGTNVCDWVFAVGEGRAARPARRRLGPV